MNLRNIALTAALLGSSLSPALAHYCMNANKAVGAGSAGTVVIGINDAGEETVDFSGVRTNKQGKIQGGFATLEIQNPDGSVAMSFETYAHVALPEKAVMSGPGDNPCDGKGNDVGPVCAGAPH